MTTLAFDGDQLAAVTYSEPAAAALLGADPEPEPAPGLAEGAEGLPRDREAQ